jgi:hypothetical protein
VASLPRSVAILKQKIDQSCGFGRCWQQQNKNKDPNMGYQAGFHGPIGRTDFLGLRTSRQGSTEIVYDDGANQRLIWRIAGEFGEVILSDVLQAAVAAQRVLPTLFEELKKRAIQIDRIGA